MGVEAIGGLFFRAKDPDALSAWYKNMLGVGAQGPDDWYWQTRGGPVVFAPFKHTTDYFDADRQWMLNLRVTQIDALLETLRAAGIEIVTKAEWDTPGTGRFARIRDPEGNPIELWQPPA